MCMCGKWNLCVELWCWVGLWVEGRWRGRGGVLICSFKAPQSLALTPCATFTPPAMTVTIHKGESIPSSWSNYRTSHNRSICSSLRAALFTPHLRHTKLLSCSSCPPLLSNLPSRSTPYHYSKSSHACVA